jgi:hypothetical protein
VEADLDGRREHSSDGTGPGALASHKNLALARYIRDVHDLTNLFCFVPSARTEVAWQEEVADGKPVLEKIAIR